VRHDQTANRGKGLVFGSPSLVVNTNQGNGSSPPQTLEPFCLERRDDGRVGLRIPARLRFIESLLAIVPEWAGLTLRSNRNSFRQIMIKQQKTQPLPWSDEEKEQLRTLVLQGKSPLAVAHALGRTILSVRKIASQLKLPLRKV